MKINQLKKKPTTRYLFICLIFFLAFYSNLKNALEQGMFFFKSPGPDEITLYESKYDAIREELQSHKIVGYVTDTHFDIKKFTWAQYTAAPTFVIQGDSPQVLIAELKNPSQVDLFCRQHQLSLLKKGTSNIMLLKKEQ